jgi:hypothetical protein
VKADDWRARFVTVDAYAAAGGSVITDLFRTESDGYLTDPALLDRLANEKLEREAEAVRQEGWKWVEIMPDLVGFLDRGQLRGSKGQGSALAAETGQSLGESGTRSRPAPRT